MRFFEVFMTAMVLLFTSAAVVSDLRTRRIPNWLTVSNLVLALVVHGCHGRLGGLIFSLEGFAAGFGVLFLLWLIGGGGGGDVKMMAALGAWLGWKLTLAVFLGSAVVTLVLATVRLAYRLIARATAGRGDIQPTGRDRRGQATPASGGDRGEKAQRFPVPYAVPVALSTWFVLAWAWKFGTLLP
jgi:prepilin peptidase CpaA